MFTDIKELGGLSRVALDTIADSYAKAAPGLCKLDGKSAKVFKNRGEVITFIEESATVTQGTPFIVTEEWLALNKLNGVNDFQVGDYIIVPIPSEEDKAREALLEQIAEVVHGSTLPEDAKASYMAQTEQMSLPELEDLLVMIKEALELAKANNDPKVETNVETPENSNSEATTEGVAIGSVQDLLQKAISDGKMRYENQLIIGYQPKVRAGGVWYELHGADGATYLASGAEVTKVINSI